MEIEALRLLLILSRTLNFTQASALAFMSQSAFSRRISQAEDSFGVKLFNRTTHDVSITPEGEKILPEIQKLVSLYDSILSDCHTLALSGAKPLHIGYSVYPFGLGFCMKVEKKLAEMNLPVKADVSFVSFEESIKALEDGRIDGLVSVDYPHSVEKLSSIRVQKSKTYAVVNCLNPLSRRDALGINDLKGEKIIISGRKSMPALFAARKEYLISSGIEDEAIIEADTAREAMLMASRGDGITILNEEGHINTIDTVKPVPLESGIAELDFVFSWFSDNSSESLGRYIEAVKAVAGSVGKGDV